MEKLKRQAGESLVELLRSMLIISLGMLMLAGAITTTARLNATAREMSTGKEDNPAAGGNPAPANETIIVKVTLGRSPSDENPAIIADNVTVTHSGNNMELYYYG